MIFSTINKEQGIRMANVENDSSLDIISTNSGDDTISVFWNINGKGTFCEVMQLVNVNDTEATIVELKGKTIAHTAELLLSPPV
ncbi:hypothetical protein ACHAWX_000887 [Stephanocyclus meneghinianus]